MYLIIVVYFRLGYWTIVYASWLLLFSYSILVPHMHYLQYAHAAWDCRVNYTLQLALKESPRGDSVSDFSKQRYHHTVLYMQIFYIFKTEILSYACRIVSVAEYYIIQYALHQNNYRRIDLNRDCSWHSKSLPEVIRFVLFYIFKTQILPYACRIVAVAEYYISFMLYIKTTIWNRSKAKQTLNRDTRH
jgi:hypothetical protein